MSFLIQLTKVKIDDSDPVTILIRSDYIAAVYNSPPGSVVSLTMEGHHHLGEDPIVVAEHPAEIDVLQNVGVDAETKHRIHSAALKRPTVLMAEKRQAFGAFAAKEAAGEAGPIGPRGATGTPWLTPDPNVPDCVTVYRSSGGTKVKRFANGLHVVEDNTTFHGHEFALKRAAELAVKYSIPVFHYTKMPDAKAGAAAKAAIPDVNASSADYKDLQPDRVVVYRHGGLTTTDLYVGDRRHKSVSLADFDTAVSEAIAMGIKYSAPVYFYNSKV